MGGLVSPNSGFLLLVCSLTISLSSLGHLPLALSLPHSHSRLMKVGDTDRKFRVFALNFAFSHVVRQVEQVTLCYFESFFSSPGFMLSATTILIERRLFMK